MAAVKVQACLNGGRTRGEHAAVPHTPAELAADAVAAHRAGAFAVHVHAHDAGGRETMAPAACDATVAAIRAAAPRLPIGLTTSSSIDPDPFARAAAIRSWRRAPDFIAVNLAELGWAGIVRAASHAGIGVEAGLRSPADAEQLVGSPFTHQVLRVLVEVDDPDEARAIADLIPDEVAQLWHGFGESTWKVLPAAIAAGHAVRVGLEDVLVLPDGAPAQSNAELVAAAVELGAPPSGTAG
jgi:uncharacterized protein (DUF849 family)